MLQTIYQGNCTMDWFRSLRACLSSHYGAEQAPDVVGYLRGSASPGVWRTMQDTRSGQMIVLGNRPPSYDDWVAAGVAGRGQIREIRLRDLAGFIVIYGGFVRRPWGHIVVNTPEIESGAFQSSLNSWRRNAH